MNLFEARELSDSDDWEAYFDLRFRVLRKPWNQARGTERDEQENSAIHAVVSHKNKFIAAGRVQLIEPGQAQIRYMAVDPLFQGKGLGSKILHFLEKKAIDYWNVKTIMLQSRENAVQFYTSNGYLIAEKTFKLWDLIQHYKMIKQL